MAFRIWIKCIAIAKCDLFFHCRDTKKITFYYFLDQKFVKNKKNKNKQKHVNFIYVVEIMFVRQMNGVVDCFHRKFRVFIKIMVRDYCIAKCKKLSACKGVLMAHWAIYSFVIQKFRLFPTLLSSSFHSSETIIRCNTNADENLIIMFVWECCLCFLLS